MDPMGEKSCNDLPFKFTEEEFHGTWGRKSCNDLPLNLQKKSFMGHGGELPVMTYP